MARSDHHGGVATAMFLNCAISLAACSWADAGMPENVKEAKSVTFIPDPSGGRAKRTKFTS